jgi:hypothetical protein
MNITCVLYLLQHVSADLCDHYHVVVKIHVKKSVKKWSPPPCIDTTSDILISWLFQILLLLLLLLLFYKEGRTE